MTSVSEQNSRRDFLYYATAGTGAVAVGAAVWPLVNQMNPSADVRALATIRVDISDLAQGSQLTNKYAEGYPHKRYYGGCEYVDVAEDLAIERAKKRLGETTNNVSLINDSHARMAKYLAPRLHGKSRSGVQPTFHGKKIAEWSGSCSRR